jgi:hypothetical protein
MHDARLQDAVVRPGNFFTAAYISSRHEPQAMFALPEVIKHAHA